MVKFLKSAHFSVTCSDRLIFAVHNISLSPPRFQSIRIVPKFHSRIGCMTNARRKFAYSICTLNLCSAPNPLRYISSIVFRDSASSRVYRCVCFPLPSPRFIGIGSRSVRLYFISATNERKRQHWHRHIALARRSVHRDEVKYMHTMAMAGLIGEICI